MEFKLMIWLASLSTIKNRNSKRGKWTDVTKEIAGHILRRYKHRKFREYGIAWKATLLVTPYIRVKRGCAGIKPIIHIFCLEGSTSWKVMCESQSCTAFQADKESDCFLSEGILSFRRVCTSVTHSVAFQAIPNSHQLNMKAEKTKGR